MKMNPRDFLNLLKTSTEKQDSNASIDEKRAEMEEICGRFPVDEEVATCSTELGGVPGIRLEPPTDTSSHILYFHGGGYIMGSPTTHLGITSALAKHSRSNVWSIDYRLAPESPYPAAVEDAVSAYRGLLEKADSPDSIVVCGDSAGGGLTVAAMLKAKTLGLPMPAGLAMMSPFADLTLSGWSHGACTDRDFMADPDTLNEMAGSYADGANREDHLVSPIFGDLAGLPPMLIHVGTEEVLLSDSTTLAERAGNAGVPVELKIWPDMPHVFQLYAKFLAAGDESIEEIANWISSRFAG